MRAGGVDIAVANGAAVQPSSKANKLEPPGAAADRDQPAASKPKRPRGRPPKTAQDRLANGDTAKHTANGTAPSSRKPAAGAPQAGHVAAGKGKHSSRAKPTAKMQQRKHGIKQMSASATAPAEEAATDTRRQRKRRRPARFDHNSSEEEQVDHDQEEASSQQDSEDEQHTSTSEGRQSSGSDAAAEDSDDSKKANGHDPGSSSSEDDSSGDSASSSGSDSDTDSGQQQVGAAARRRRPAAGARKAAAKQESQQQRQRQKPAARPTDRGAGRKQGPAAKGDTGNNNRKQKGPLARVKAADAGPRSSNTTTTTNSTQLLGGAARPIPEITSYHQAVRRVNHQIQRISTEEHLLQTYTADGWKGASKEKVRLTDDLKRAQQTLARCRESIRQACRYCEEVHPGPPIPQDAYDSDGEVDVTDIFCAKCQKKESSDDNDLVLCDGPCNRAYHECCLNPRLVAADIPEDEGWLCPACDAKMDILIQINDYYDTEYELTTSWQELFNESAEEQEARQLERLRSGDLLSPRAGKAAAAAGFLAEEFPSSDNEDNNYSASDHDEVEGKHRPRKRQRSSSSKRQRNGAAAASSSSSSHDGSSSSGSGSDSDDEAVSLHSEDGVQLSDADAADADQPLRRSKRSSAVNGVAAAAIAAGATPRQTGGAKKQGVKGSGSVEAAVAGAAGGGRGNAGARRRKPAAAGSDSDSDTDESADEQQQQRHKRHRSGGSASRRKRRDGSKVDYKQLHEQLFGFAAFEGDDDVFREEDDHDYSGSDSGSGDSD